MLRRHERRVARLKDPRAVVAEGQSFAQAIALGEALLYFYMTIDNFPLWYAETNDEASWSSKTIPRGLVGYCDLRELTGLIGGLRMQSPTLPDFQVSGRRQVARILCVLR